MGMAPTAQGGRKFFTYDLPLPFPAPTSGPVLVLYYDHQAGSWFSSYRFSFSFSKLLALGRT